MVRGSSNARRRTPQTAAGGVIRCHPLTPDRWADAERLFGPRGACAGCWCMYWRLTAKQWQSQRGAPNQRALHRLVNAGPPPGVLAYAGREPVGWCALAPRSDYVRLDRSRVLAPVDNESVWSVTCFFVAKPYRGRGLTTVLLDHAAQFAAKHGAHILEGYPIDPSARQADAFMFTGLLPAFLRAGFHEVARRSPTRPIVRRALSP